MENPYLAPQHQNESSEQTTLKPTLLGSVGILLLAFPCVFALAFAYRTTFLASCVSAVVISTPIALVGGYLIRRCSSSIRRRMLVVALLPMIAICIGSIFIRHREEKIHDAVERIRQVNAEKRQTNEITGNPSEEPRTK
jgi:carbon starvation protein CstA